MRPAWVGVERAHVQTEKRFDGPASRDVLVDGVDQVLNAVHEFVSRRLLGHDGSQVCAQWCVVLNLCGSMPFSVEVDITGNGG